MKYCLVLWLMLVMTACGREADDSGYHLDSEHPLFHYFAEKYSGRKALLSLSGDCNNDGREDLVIVFRDSKTENKLVAVYSYNDEYRMTEPIPAPVENCRLQWKDIDERPPVELLVSGQKGIHIGYAVFRLVDGQWVSLFGEGMERCC